MKIIQVMPEFGLAGAEIMCENLTNALISLGNEVVVISLFDYHSPITDRLESKGVRIEYLGKKSGIDLSIISKLRKVFIDEKPDVIHTHRYLLKYVIPAKRHMNIRVIHTVHNIAKKENNKLDRTLNRYFFKHCQVTPVALTDMVKESILREYALQPDEVPVILNGVPLEKCIKKEKYDFGEYINILHIGRYSEAKNHKEIIKAIVALHDSIPKIRIHFIGEGTYKEQIMKDITQARAQSFIIEHGTTSDSFKYLNEADIFILPSLYEGMPITLIEAMGTALPIVASKVGGIPDMIKDGEEGLLCEPTSESIAKTIMMLIKDQMLRETLGKNAAQKAMLYSANIMAESYTKVYKSRL